MSGTFTSIKHKLTAFLVDDFSKKPIFRFVPDRMVYLFDYLITFGKIPDLKNPRTFSEKMQWIKLHGNLESIADLADKYEVRGYVKKTIGSRYLVPLYGVWDKFDDINFDRLPNKFALKATHGSYYNFICRNKKEINRNKLKNAADKWLSENFYRKMREIQYRPIKPRIIAEKYLEDESGSLNDYKFLCFKGKIFAVDVHVDRFTHHRTFYVNEAWKKLPIRVAFEPALTPKIPLKPKNWKNMVSVAKKLSRNFPFVRVDLYSVHGKTYFGELTFTPGMGLLPLKPDTVDYKMGKLLDITLYAKMNKSVK